MVATAAWAGYEYVSTNAKIEQLQAELYKQQSYVRKVRKEDKQRYHEVFIATTREMRQLSALATESTCLVKNTRVCSSWKMQCYKSTMTF